MFSQTGKFAYYIKIYTNKMIQYFLERQCRVFPFLLPSTTWMLFRLWFKKKPEWNVVDRIVMKDKHFLYVIINRWTRFDVILKRYPIVNETQFIVIRYLNTVDSPMILLWMVHRYLGTYLSCQLSDRFPYR